MKSNNLSFPKILITAFAMFSMMFGGGNFILPPLLGLKAGDAWWIVCLSFGISAVIIPLLGVLTQAKLQGTMLDMGKKIHPIFGLIIGILMYAICLSFPIPRTASVTYELAIEQYIPISSFWFSVIYFLLVMYLCFNRSKVLDIIGKYLTPILLTIIILIILKAIFFVDGKINHSLGGDPFQQGLLEGYQTFDGIASIIIGGVIISSLNVDKTLNYAQKKKLTIYAGIISSIALFSIYSGFIYTGAVMNDYFPQDITRTNLLSGIGQRTLGVIGESLLNLSVSIACFTTAVGIIAGAADFIKHLFNDSNMAYKLTVLCACIIGVIVGKTGTENIISIALPVLVLIYPIVITLIMLNIAPDKWTSSFIFRSVIFTSFIFAIPEFLLSIGVDSSTIIQYLPLSSYNLSWLIPALFIWGVALIFRLNKK